MDTQPAWMGEERMMYEDKYPLTEIEREHFGKVQQRIRLHGRVLIKYNEMTGEPILNAENQAIQEDFVRLRGSPTLAPRFIVDFTGTIWPWMARGASKCPHLPDGGGSRAHSDYVEMWTGKWRKIKHPDQPNTMTYAKNTIYINMENQVQGHESIPKIEWMKSKKGYKHPLADPQYPMPMQIREMESKLRSAAPVILAQQQQELATSGVQNADEYLKQAQAAAAQKLEAVPGLEDIPPAERRPEPIIMQPPQPEPTPTPVEDLRISKQAQTFAAAHGLDIAGLNGTGNNGRIVIEDVRALMPPESTAAVAVAEPPSVEPSALQPRTNQHDTAQP